MTCKAIRVCDMDKDSPMNRISSRLRFVFAMLKCMRAGCLVMMEAHLIENSFVCDDKSLWLKFNFLIVVFLFMASTM